MERIGTEFQVNTTTAGNQLGPNVAALADGGYIVTWLSNYTSVFAQRYDGNGNRIGSEFLVVNQDDSLPNVTGLTNGGFVITYNDFGRDGSDEGVFARVYDAAGNAVGGEFQVNTTSQGFQVERGITSLKDGGFLIAYDSQGAAGGWFVLAQRYDASGNRVGGEFQVTPTTTSDLSYPTAAGEPAMIGLSDGGFIIAWESHRSDGNWDVHAQRYDSTSTAVGGELLVNTTKVDSLGDHVSLTGLPNGGFVFAWSFDGNIAARIYDASSTAVGSEFQVNTTTAADLEPWATALADGGFLVTWEAYGPDGSGYGVFGQQFDATGNKVGVEFQVNSYTANHQDYSSSTVLTNGTVVVVWDSVGQDGDSGGDYGQLFKISNSPAVIGDPTVHDVTEDSNVNGAGDLTAAGTISISDIDQNQSSFQTSVTGAQGDLGGLLLAADGSYIYSVANSAVQYLGASETKGDTFTVTSLDGTTKDVNFTIHGVNDAPIAAWDVAAVQKNSSIRVDAQHGVLANDSDPDLHDVLSVSAIRFGTTTALVSLAHPATLHGKYGSLTIHADGSYSYRAGSDDQEDDSEDRRDKGSNDQESRSDKTNDGAAVVPQDIFIYTANDGHGGTITADLILTVYPPGGKYFQGTAGSDTLIAGNGASILDGGDGNDVLKGGNGGDWLIGGRGHDTITGGKGADTFVFGASFGHDVITDFSHIDTIQMDRSLTSNFSDLISHHAQQVGANTVISFGTTDTITLSNVALVSLHASSFHFV